MREGTNRYLAGKLIDGYDYDLQVWVKGGQVIDCNHPDSMKANGCCNGHKHAYRQLDQLRAELGLGRDPAAN